MGRVSTTGKQIQIDSLASLVKQAAAFRFSHLSSFPGAGDTPAL